jgi:hypothetical protein
VESKSSTLVTLVVTLLPEMLAPTIETLNINDS